MQSRALIQESNNSVDPSIPVIFLAPNYTDLYLAPFDLKGHLFSEIKLCFPIEANQLPTLSFPFPIVNFPFICFIKM